MIKVTASNYLKAECVEDFLAISKELVEKTNSLDGAVIITDCDYTCAGLLGSCIATNTPTVVLPLGCYNTMFEDFVPRHQSTFFCLLEKLGLVAPGASTNKRGSNAQMAAALETGKMAVADTTELKLPKKMFTKTSLQEVVDHCIMSGFALDGLRLIARLFKIAEVKPSNEYLADRLEALNKKGEIDAPVITKRLGGTALGGSAFIQTKTKAVFAGNAWVYQTLEDADTALCGGAIPANSVIVLQNCEGLDVSAIAHTIVKQGRVAELAIATDGVCEVTDVLCVQLCTPSSNANEEFANIQNGDALKIDVKEGRFNSNVLAKDLKNRAKRNTIRKTPIYF